MGHKGKHTRPLSWPLGETKHVVGNNECTPLAMAPDRHPSVLATECGCTRMAAPKQLALCRLVFAAAEGAVPPAAVHLQFAGLKGSQATLEGLLLLHRLFPQDVDVVGVIAPWDVRDACNNTRRV